MDVVDRTLSIPVWYDETRIFVPTVDIPMGKWTLILSLTPIVAHDAATPHSPDPHKIESVVFHDVPASVSIDARAWCTGWGWIVRFDNALQAGDPPKPIHYTVTVSGFPLAAAVGKPARGAKARMRMATRTFDPVIVGQPDPIYP